MGRWCLSRLKLFAKHCILGSQFCAAGFGKFLQTPCFEQFFPLMISSNRATPSSASYYLLFFWNSGFLKPWTIPTKNMHLQNSLIGFVQSFKFCKFYSYWGIADASNTCQCSEDLSVTLTFGGLNEKPENENYSGVGYSLLWVRSNPEWYYVFCWNCSMYGVEIPGMKSMTQLNFWTTIGPSPGSSMYVCSYWR